MYVFNKDITETHPPRLSIEHAIELAAGYNMHYWRIWKGLEFKLRILKAYRGQPRDQDYSGIIMAIGAQILFATNRERRLRLLVK